jgi:hypothetical protein
VSDGVPYFLLGAGFLRPSNGEHAGVVMVLMARTTNPDLGDPQRRAVFPLLFEYVRGEG